MNRGWKAGRLKAFRDGAFGSEAEDREQLHLDDAIRVAAGSAHRTRYFLDLHTTSAGGVPFSMIRDVPEQIAFASGFGLPVIIGLLERIDGALLEYMREQGFVCMGVEGGRNGDPASIDHHEAVLWVALVATGILAETAVPRLSGCRAQLRKARGALPAVTRITHRHAIAPGDHFKMEPGFDNIQRIRGGDLLARDRNGEIHAHEPGLLLMPLYQAQGDDGFFLGREVQELTRDKRI
jgi:hypothetical protein